MLYSVARMIQLAFEPAYDPFHAAFRILRQAVFRIGTPVELRRAKIVDLYIAEPRRCLDIRLSGALKTAARKAAACQPATYGHRPAATALFNRMSPMQDAAIQTLVMQGLLEADAFQRGFVVRTEEPLSDSLNDRISEANLNQFALMSFVCAGLDEIPVDGAKGMKDRTGIGEFRYDII
jgi:hypothetical protein